MSLQIERPAIPSHKPPTVIPPWILGAVAASLRKDKSPLSLGAFRSRILEAWPDTSRDGLSWEMLCQAFKARGDCELREPAWSAPWRNGGGKAEIEVHFLGETYHPVRAELPLGKELKAKGLRVGAFEELAKRACPGPEGGRYPLAKACKDSCSESPLALQEWVALAQESIRNRTLVYRDNRLVAVHSLVPMLSGPRHLSLSFEVRIGAALLKRLDPNNTIPLSKIKALLADEDIQLDSLQFGEEKLSHLLRKFRIGTVERDSASGLPCFALCVASLRKAAQLRGPREDADLEFSIEKEATPARGRVCSPFFALDESGFFPLPVDIPCPPSILTCAFS